MRLKVWPFGVRRHDCPLLGATRRAPVESGDVSPHSKCTNFKVKQASASLKLFAKFSQLSTKFGYLLLQGSNFILQSTDALDLRRATNLV